MSDTGEQQGSSNAMSVLGNLKERRAQVLEEQVLDLPVPRWTNPTIVVRYRPVEHTLIRRAQSSVDKAPKRQKSEMEVDVNADILIRGCKEVVAVVDGEEYSLREGEPEGDPTAFDADLAKALGLDTRATARQVVRSLFLTDGDILSAATSVITFSGYKETEADEAVSGE